VATGKKYDGIRRWAVVNRWDGEVEKERQGGWGERGDGGREGRGLKERKVYMKK
jgi:hypothetical protein